MTAPNDWREAIIYLGKRCKSWVKSNKLEQKAEEVTTAKKAGLGESYTPPSFSDTEHDNLNYAG